MRAAIAFVGALGLALVGLWYLNQGRFGGAATLPHAVPATSVAPGASDGLSSAAATKPDAPLEDCEPWQRVLPPRSRVPLRLKPQKQGIRCPDGTYLPLLNGVPHAPPISRSTNASTLTPVVELLVDDTGCQWFVHADGSATTSRWVDYTDSQGKRDRQVVTDHNEVVPGEYGLLGDGTPATQPMRKGR